MSAFRNTPTAVLADAAEATGDLIEAAQWMSSVCDYDPDELLLHKTRYRQMRAELESRSHSVKHRQAQQSQHREVRNGSAS